LSIDLRISVLHGIKKEGLEIENRRKILKTCHSHEAFYLEISGSLDTDFS